VQFKGIWYAEMSARNSDELVEGYALRSSNNGNQKEDILVYTELSADQEAVAWTPDIEKRELLQTARAGDE
jgi:hypothetical protein